MVVSLTIIKIAELKKGVQRRKMSIKSILLTLIPEIPIKIAELKKTHLT